MTQPRRFFRRLGKVSLFAIVLSASALAVAHYAWKYSGSNKWELVREANGVKVYALKVPGSTLEQFRGVTRLRTNLNTVVATMTDTSTEACREFVPGCVSGKIFKPFDSQTRSFVQAYRLSFGKKLAPRDIVIKTDFSRDPRTKSLLVTCNALPGMIPTDRHAVRITDMHNSWRYTPLGNGEVLVELTVNYDAGVPYFLFNHVGPLGIPTFLPRLQSMFDKEQYQHKHFSFVDEL